MQTEPIEIPGLAGPAVVTVNTLTGKHSITVGGQEYKPVRRAAYELPTADGGTVPALLKTSFLAAYPSIVVSGGTYPTGPATPIYLQILALLPAALIAVAGCIGGLFAGLAIVSNLAIARSRIAPALKALAMVGVLVLTSIVTLIVRAAIQQA